MSESGFFDNFQRAKKAADAVRVGTEQARERAALDPASSPQVILAKAATKIVLDSASVEDTATRAALIKKAEEVAIGYATGGRPLPTPSGETPKRTKQL